MSPKTCKIMKRKKENGQDDCVYTCKTCNKKFSSFQALGGHRTGHNNCNKINAAVISGVVPTCSFCNKTFDSGQALGGHMGKHRDAMKEKVKPLSSKKAFVSENYKEVKTLRLFGRVCAVESEAVSQESCVEENKKLESQKPKILLPENLEEPKSLQLEDSILVEEKPMSDSSLTLVLWDFFRREPAQVEEVPAEIIPKWLQLTL